MGYSGDASSVFFQGPSNDNLNELMVRGRITVCNMHVLTVLISIKR